MKRVLKIGAVVFGILLVIAVGIPLFVGANAFRPKLESELADAKGREVKIGNLSGKGKTPGQTNGLDHAVGLFNNEEGALKRKAHHQAQRMRN